MHGESLVASAAWALGEAGVTVVDLVTEWDELVAAEAPFVLHDALCPLTPPAFVDECVRHAAERSAVTVGVRPVTDTVKQLRDGTVGDTVDRTALLQVVSPVVLPAGVVAALDGVPVPRLRRAGGAARRAVPGRDARGARRGPPGRRRGRPARARGADRARLSCPPLSEGYDDERRKSVHSLERAARLNRPTSWAAIGSPEALR